MKTLRILAVTAAVFAAGSTFAQSPSLLGDPALSLSNVSVGAEAGTTGYGVNFGYDVTPNTSLNIGWAGGRAANIRKTMKIDGDDLKTHNRAFENTSIIVKYAPFTQQYADLVNVQFGVYVQDSDITLKDKASNVKVGKIAVGPAVNPYLGIGIAPKINSHWGVNFDVGTIYQGKLVAAASDDSGQEIVVSSRYRWFPVAKAGISYHF